MASDWEEPKREQTEDPVIICTGGFALVQNTRVFLVYFLHEKKYFGHECGAQRRTSAQNIFSSARNTRGKLEYSARVRIHAVPIILYTIECILLNIQVYIQAI